jgi:FkbM family methyltransferase
VRNLDANGCANVFCYPYAITADGRTLALSGDPDTNTGGFGAFGSGPVVVTDIESRTLPSILEAEHIERIDLLKLDCEGAEYEILHGLNGQLGQVKRLIMEVHESATLRDAHGSADALIAYAGASVPSVRATVIGIGEAANDH